MSWISRCVRVGLTTREESIDLLRWGEENEIYPHAGGPYLVYYFPIVYEQDLLTYFHGLDSDVVERDSQL